MLIIIVFGYVGKSYSFLKRGYKVDFVIEIDFFICYLKLVVFD